MKCPPYCKGCIYRSNTNGEFNACDYMFVTGRPRGCLAGPDCTKYTAYGKKWGKKNNITLKPQKPKQPPKPKRIPLTSEERRDHRNALRRKENAKKKAAKLLEQSNGAVENNSI